MKQFEATTKTIGENTFFIRPMPAFRAANISGELASFVTPIVSAVAPQLGGEKSITDVSIEEITPALSNSMATVSGDRLEHLFQLLLTDSGSIAVQGAGDDQPQKLTEDVANEVFCGNVQDMFVLAFEVIKINFGGFFKKLGTQFGSVTGKLGTPENMKNTVA